MKTIAVPIEHPTYGSLRKLVNEIDKQMQAGYWPRIGQMGALYWFADRIDAAPPQSEPLRCNLTGMKGCAYPVNAAPDDRSGFLPLNVAAKGSAEGAQTVNGSARDANAGSSNAIQDPSFAAPDYHICYSVAEDRSHCVTCGRELLDLAVSAAPRFEDELLKPQTVISLTGTPNFSGAFTTGAAVSTTLPGAITSGLTVSSGFVTNNGAGQGSVEAHPPCTGANDPAPAAPASTLPPCKGKNECHDDETEKRTWRIKPSVPISHLSSGPFCSGKSGDAAPTTMNLGEQAESALPLSVEQIEEWRRKMHRKIYSEFCGEPNEAHWLVVRDSFNSLCDQALRAIELEQQVANEQARSRTLVNAAIIATERAEKAEAVIVERDREIAELRKDAATIASMIQNVIVERRVK